MNKALAILLLVIGNMAAVCALSAINFFMFFLTISPFVAVLIGLAAVTVLGFASSRLLPVFERKLSLEAKWFILAAYGSPVIGAMACWIADDLALFPFITAMAYLISGAIWSDIKIRV